MRAAHRPSSSSGGVGLRSSLPALRSVATLLLLGALLAPVGTSPSQGAQLPQTRIRAIPAKAQIALGQIVSVDVRIRGARNVGSVPFTLVYDPGILEPVTAEVIEGPFLRRDGSQTAFMTRPSQSSPGSWIVGLSRLRSDRGAEGKGTLCRLRFKALREGTSALQFARAAVLDPQAQHLPATFETSSIRVKGRK